MDRGKALSLASFAALATACSVPVAAALSEEDANRVVVSLEHAGIPTSKEADPSAEGKYRVAVPKEDAARAVEALREEELPPRAAPGLLDALGKSSLVPSAAVEHAQYLAGIAGELERTLASIDGVVAARVHVSVPAPDPLGERSPQRSTASVLVKHRGATPPVDAPSVQRLVAGAVAGMRADDVAVVMIPRPVIPPAPASQIVYVGPIAVTRGSMAYVKLFGAIAGLLVVGLSATVLWLFSKQRRALDESEKGEARA